MIYLIDDKKSRQELLGWDQSKVEKHNSILKTVYSFKQIKAENLNTKDRIYAKNSIILFHESFFDKVENVHKVDSIAIRNELIDWCGSNNIPLVQFSGSTNKRSKKDKNVSLHVKIMYQNLELFINSVTNNDDINQSLNILLFGENFNIEEILHLKKQIWETKFKFSPLLNSKIKELNTLINKNIDLKITQNPIILKSLINE